MEFAVGEIERFCFWLANLNHDAASVSSCCGRRRGRSSRPRTAFGTSGCTGCAPCHRGIADGSTIYADHCGVAKIERRDGTAVLSSVSVGYDRSGLPVSVTDQDGLVTACDRDALGRIAREKYANDTEVAYAYDKLGRLATVVDENGHEIKFGWDRFGLASRLTAANQKTETRRDANGREKWNRRLMDIKSSIQ